MCKWYINRDNTKKFAFKIEYNRKDLNIIFEWGNKFKTLFTEEELRKIESKSYIKEKNIMTIKQDFSKTDLEIVKKDILRLLGGDGVLYKSNERVRKEIASTISESNLVM